MPYQRGDIVLVPFPFADLTASKTRPALVINTDQFLQDEGKLLLAGITSNILGHRGPTNYRLTAWKKAGLLKPSVVTAWLACLSPNLVQAQVGTLPVQTMRAVDRCLRAALGL